jgi:hypothetical protein
MLDVRDVAYAAALVDTLGVLSLREVGPTQLPNVAIQGRYAETLAWLGEMTGTRLTTISRDFVRNACNACTHHCPEPHVHIKSTSVRWVVTGVKATIVLHNLAPFMRVQRDAALTMVEAGRTIGYKGNVIEQMREKGWEIPNLKKQPRARISLDDPVTTTTTV